MQMANTPTKPALIRLKVAAELLGLSAQHLKKSALDGTMPITLVKVGKIAFFRSVELNQYLSGDLTPDNQAFDLF